MYDPDGTFVSATKAAMSAGTLKVRNFPLKCAVVDAFIGKANES